MGVQSSYGNTLTVALEGQLADDGDHDVIAMTNAEASASIAFGRAVKKGTGDTEALLPAAETDEVVGITMHSHAYSNGENGDLDDTGMKVGAVMNVLRKGRIWVRVNGAVVAFTSRLWVRAVGSTPPEYLGGIEDADDSTDMIDCTKQGQFITSAATGELAVLEVNFLNKP